MVCNQILVTHSDRNQLLFETRNKIEEFRNSLVGKCVIIWFRLRRFGKKICLRQIPVKKGRELMRVDLREKVCYFYFQQYLSIAIRRTWWLSGKIELEIEEITRNSEESRNIEDLTTKVTGHKHKIKALKILSLITDIHTHIHQYIVIA